MSMRNFTFHIPPRTASDLYNKGVEMFTVRPEMAEHLREEYPAGTRVELVQMDDCQAPPVGTLGTVIGVDDTGSLLFMHWDNGSGLNVIYGIDVVKKIKWRDIVEKIKS